MENKRIQQLAELYEWYMEVTLSENEKIELFKIYLKYRKGSPEAKSLKVIYLARSSGKTHLLRELIVLGIFEDMEKKNGK